MTTRIRRANRASTAQLAESVVPTIEATDGARYAVTVATADDLSPDDQGRIFDIFRTNMHALYLDSSFGWCETTKKAELFDPLSRFILLRRVNDSNSPLMDNCVAFAMFRFDREGGERVIYCYEMQLSPLVQRKGLGTVLMQQLVRIGSRWGMQKLMLTALKSNTAAAAFYKRCGLAVDHTSPGHGSDEMLQEEQNESDYEILSMKLS